MSEQMKAVIDYLFEVGFEADGLTQGSHYKIITRESYPLAGKNIDIPGRQRFKRGNELVTVGKRTTCIYVKGTKPINRGFGHPFYCDSMQNVPTKNLEWIRKYIGPESEQTAETAESI